MEEKLHLSMSMSGWNTYKVICEPFDNAPKSYNVCLHSWYNWKKGEPVGIDICKKAFEEDKCSARHLRVKELAEKRAIYFVPYEPEKFKKELEEKIALTKPQFKSNDTYESDKDSESYLRGWNRAKKV